MWPESQKVYPYLRAVPNRSELSWKFPSGATVKFGHMQHEVDKNNWLGAQIALIGFDQLERFSEDQFFYMLSRNRSTCGIKPYIRATANPEPNWLAKFLSWWIDDATGYPIPERSGKLRWFVRRDNVIQWSSDPGDLPTVTYEDEDGEHILPPKSVTFIPAKLEDNQELMRLNPEYLANLLSMSYVDQQRYYRGNWKVSSADGEFDPLWFGPEIWFDNWPTTQLKVVALDPSKGLKDKSGDFSAYIVLGLDASGLLWCDAEIERRRVPKIVSDGLRLMETHGAHALGVETNAFQDLFCPLFIEEAKKRSVKTLPIYGMNNVIPKTVRIKSLAPVLAQRRIRFKRSAGGEMLVEQLRGWRGDESAPHTQDGPDALEMALRLLMKLMGRRTGHGDPKAVEVV